MKTILSFMLYLGFANGCLANESPKETPEPEKNQVYKTIDNKGRVIFSDHPVDKEKSQAIKLLDPNIQPPPAHIPTPTASESASKTTYQIQLGSPPEGARFGPADRSVRVALVVTPSLETGHQIVYFLSGIQISGPTRSLTADIPLGLKQRGEQAVSASIIDVDGITLAKSTPANIYVIRP